MPFVSSRKDEQEFLITQGRLPDRIAGLVWPILIDRRLRATIEARWKDDSKKDVLRSLFEDRGPLGDAGARVHVGFAIGLYDEEMMRDLKLIVKIRNTFAHEPGVHSLDAAPIHNFVAGLKLVERYPIGPTAPILSATGTTRDQWLQNLMRTSGLIDVVPRRSRFLRAIEIVLTWLAVEANEITYSPSPDYQPPPLLTSPAT